MKSLAYALLVLFAAMNVVQADESTKNSAPTEEIIAEEAAVVEPAEEKKD